MHQATYVLAREIIMHQATYVLAREVIMHHATYVLAREISIFQSNSGAQLKQEEIELGLPYYYLTLCINSKCFAYVVNTDGQTWVNFNGPDA
jgi:hypothetical protein